MNSTNFMLPKSLNEIWEKDIEEIANQYRKRIKESGIHSIDVAGDRSYEEHMAFFRALFDNIKLQGSISVYDIGCGKGELLPFLHQTYPELKISQYVGIDLIDEFVSDAQSNFPHYTFVKANFIKDDFIPGMLFDLVVALGVLVKRVNHYDLFVEYFIKKMLQCSSKHVLFNLISEVDLHSESYVDYGQIGHSTSFSDLQLEGILSAIPEIDYHIAGRRIFTDATDVFITITKK